ncbi:AraC family transcriptional regulator [Nocardia sp. NPDC004068]|uniref:AraC family transcriptional regulator n=1 Tax=Nocardia sp. NPDC004068 TaxID=3364303 RepID=UPI0036D128D2
MADSPTVLETHELFRTTDPSAACARNSRILRRHSLRTLGTSPPFEAIHCATRWGTVSVHRWSFGPAVELSGAPGADAYLVTVPCRGRIATGAGRGRADAAIIANPFRPFSLCWSPGCVALTVRIESAALTTHLAAMLRRPVSTGPDFGPVFDLRGPGRAWVRLIRAWIDLAEVSPTRLGHPPMAAAIEQSLMTGLLVAAHHDFSEALLGADTTPPPLRRVLERIERDPAADATVAELAAAAGLSVRALQDNFARYLSTTPTAYVREARLRRAHADLLATDPADRGAVGAVARRWGFGNSGRFAREYRSRFGQPPGQTLRERPEPPRDH